MSKQIFIAVNGTTQFPVTLQEGESVQALAAKAHGVLKLSPALKPRILPGLINFVAR